MTEKQTTQSREPLRTRLAAYDQACQRGTDFDISVAASALAAAARNLLDAEDVR